MYKVTPEQITAWVYLNFEGVKPRKNGIELRINNPFNGDTGYHFNISVGKGTCHDWRGDGWVNREGSKYKPTFLRFVQLYKNCTYAQAIQEVCGQNVSLRSIELELRRQRTQKEEEKPEVLLALPESQKLIGSTQPKMAAMLINWLQSRGLSLEHIKRYDLRHYADTVIWPYYEYDMLVYWQSRNRLNKVFNFPDVSVGVSKSMFFYGFDMIEPNDYVVITEAIFGAHTLEVQTVASGGAILSERQIRKLRVFNPLRGVILAPDNDAAGLQSVADNYKLIKPYYPVFHSIPPKIEYVKDGNKEFTKDWNELYTGVGMPLSEIRSVFESNVVRTDIRHITNFMNSQLQ